ncbi:oligosaccharide flippase family protein [Ruminococcus albus]|uniref:Membrane protein involved in the export of O-antigen and teichoic acid n=1 Tax=Ruminococcus albus TaxID=1264 RepID=A0A1I1CU91_RUMAL|nr:oligosaccharide flippase family protein [Ruminococcus albus]SFB66299.1 Membrane protein involved in the export of O-antigen and teichoic acid [Ruminococcus albus]
MKRTTGVLLSYVLIFFEALSTLLLTPYIIRTLGQAEYGVYKLTIAINTYLLLLDLGIGNAVTRYIAKFKTNKNKIQEKRFLGIVTLYYIIIAVIALLSGIILVVIFPRAFSKGLSTNEVVLGQKLLSITMINSAITLGTAAYNNVIIAYEKFFVSKGSAIIQIILRMIVTYFALKAGMGSIGIVSVNLIMTVLCRIYYVLYVLCVIKLVPTLKGIELSFVKEIIIYSSLILLQMIATQINATVDQILIGALVTGSSVILAVYGVGTQIVQYFQTFGSAFTGVLMPGIVKMVENKASAKQLTDEMIRIGRIILIVLALIWSVFLVNGKEFIKLWAGQENINGYYVAIILMTVNIFVLTEAVGTQVLWAMNAHKEQSYLKITIVLCNILLTIVLIKWNPLIGATIGTFISVLLGDVVVLNLIFIKKIGMNLIYYYKMLFKGIIPCAGIIIIIGFIINQFLASGLLCFLLKSFIMVILYCGFLLLFGLNQYEKQLFGSLITKVRRGSTNE